MCRKLETEEEKVLPFYASTLSEQEEKEIDAMQKQEPENELANVGPNLNSSFKFISLFVLCLCYHESVTT